MVRKGALRNCLPQVERHAAIAGVIFERKDRKRGKLRNLHPHTCLMAAGEIGTLVQSENLKPRKNHFISQCKFLRSVSGGKVLNTTGLM